MISRTRTVVAAFALSLCSLAVVPSSAQVAIERIAPENTVFFVGAKNIKTMREQLQRTPLWALWQSKELQDMRADMVKTMVEDMDKMFQELGVEKDTLVCPDGAVGFAMFTTRDPETDLPMPGFLGVADYGSAENAEKTEKLVQAALTRGEEDGEIEFDSKDIAGRTVYTIDLAKIQEKAAEGEGEEEFDFNPMPMPDPSEMMKGLNALHFVRDGHSFMLSSDIKALASALERTDPKANGPLVDRADCKAVLAKINEHDMYGVMLTRDVMDLFSAADPMGMAEMMKPTLRALVGEVQGYGFGMKLDSSSAMVEQTVFALMPNGKAGLTKLMDQPAARAAVPAFVGPDAVSYTTMTLDMTGLMDVITKVVESNPMLAAQMGPQLEMMAPTVNQITSTMGNRMHWSTSATKPFGIANQNTLMAIECAKPQEFEGFFSGLAAQMGLEARDFLGQRIYTIDPEMMMMMAPVPMEAEAVSIGIGGGFVMFGGTPAVENALRATGAGAAAGVLSTSADFQRAIGALSNDPVIAWGYSDTVDAMESQFAVQRETMENMIKQMREDAAEWAKENGEEGAAGMDEFNAEFEADMRESMKMWEMFNFALLRKHIGPGAWQVTSTDDGFMMKAYLLGAGE